jgi:hypothetical protein
MGIIYGTLALYTHTGGEHVRRGRGPGRPSEPAGQIRLTKIVDVYALRRVCCLPCTQMRTVRHHEGGRNKGGAPYNAFPSAGNEN